LLAAAQRLGTRPRLVPWTEAAARLGAAPVAVSTVPHGAADNVFPDGAPVGQLGTVLPGTVLLDVVYRPWPTALARAWVAAGGVAVPGLEMLVHQAARQVRTWTGREPDVAAMRAAGAAVLATATG
jgi:shikimate dehydrogenase